ncbi:hypothetical protein ES332_A12G241400v1 [Gossypium tomentosum]|uniref:HTH myb-type domain-containing protein n=1 Tax=Gossypium tomentosum TaxID=34277 RepID=A0A5D2N1A7_GOSTO|nr:hypothetical protein ES332_A12G241400v1 [Gossypium tomentosum]
MICTTNDLSEWKDFPKGLKVLLLDEDSNSAAELKSKLEAMDYIVYTFCNENEALSAVSSRPESFHVAIVEINTNKKNGSFKFLETAKNLPTIMTSNIHCISTMMKCIAVDWTPALHKKFVQAVDQLGIDQAIPSRILELMKVEGLTRHNVASHLQKYRMHRKHILPKEDNRRWPQRDQTQRSCYPHKPIIAFPPHYSNHDVPVGPLYPMWGAPSSIQMWGSQGYPLWQPTESWHWKPYPGAHADAWGCPVMPPPHGYSSAFTQVSSYQNASVFHCSGTMDNRSGMPQNSVEHQPAEEVIDKVVKEAISKPWLPLPLGLKPPSTDTVLADLSKQGISTFPPHINGPNSSCHGTT